MQNYLQQIIKKPPFSQLSLLLLFFSLNSCSYYLGNRWAKSFPNSNSQPQFKRPLGPSATLDPDTPPSHLFPTENALPLLRKYADSRISNWQEGGKVNATRSLLAKLALKQDLDSLNLYLQKCQPWGKTGTSSKLNPQGDYDFTTITLCAILYLYQDQPDRLFPATQDHIVNTLLVESGGKVQKVEPRLLLIKETENHFLMNEGSRYLKNQWLKNHGNTDPRYDNQQNGLEKWFIKHLDEMAQTGFFEFNADPYLGYTLTALLTIEAFFESAEIRETARYILDQVNWKYGWGSLQMRRTAPFRRRMERASDTRIQKDPHTNLMQLWYARAKGLPLNSETIPHNQHQALWAYLMPYSPPEEVLDLCEPKSQEWFFKVGHGYHSSPEIYSGGPNYLLCAGGFQRSKVSQIAAMPTVLLLDDNAKRIEACFHLPGKGKMRQWNNSGVYRNFACSDAPVVIPSEFSPIAKKGNWQICRYKNLFIAIFNRPNIGILALFPDWQSTAQALADQLHQINDPSLIYQRTNLPDGGSLHYDLKAAKGLWVMEAVNNQPLHRQCDRWPRFSGDPVQGK